MPRALRPVLAVVVMALLLALAPPFAPRAAAQPGEVLQLDVTDVTPGVVRASSPQKVTITGTLTNTGGHTLRDLEARVQRAAPRATEASVRQALRDNADTSVATRFTKVADTLAAGERTRFTLRVALTGGPESLQVDRPGVYPLLININGDLARGNRARLAVARFMLPIPALPGSQSAAPEEPTPVTTLVPLVGRPKVLQQGFPGRPTVLADDRLATSLAPGGRLHGLVEAVARQVPEDSPLGRGLCFAIDPDLLVTARAMAGGYLVRQDDGSTIEGAGSEAAKRWLDQLRQVTADRCVISLPYADADIVALGRAGLGELVRNSLESAELFREVLGVEPRSDLLWPINGALTGPAATRLADSGISTVLMHPEALAAAEGSRRPVRIATGDATYSPVARPIDPLTSAVLDPQRNSTAGSTPFPPSADTTTTVQDALGALTFRATHGEGAKRSIIAPPRRWGITEQDLRSLLSGLAALAEAGYVRPAGLPRSTATASAETPRAIDEAPTPSEASRTQPAAAGAGTPAQRPAGSAPRDAESAADGTTGAPSGSEPGKPRVALNYPVTAATEEIPQEVLGQLDAANNKIEELHRAAEPDPALNIAPAEVTTPLRNGLLRGASGAWRGDPAAARRWVGTAVENMQEVLSSVRISEFAGQIILTSSNSPIPVTVNNDLPVTVAVNLHVDAPPGIEVDELGLLKIPANGSRPFLLETQVERAGKFTVDITIRTEGGTQLGQTRRMQLESNAYGTVPLIITISGAALLVLLSARRIVRRSRATRTATAGTGAEPGDTAGNDRKVN